MCCNFCNRGPVHGQHLELWHAFSVCLILRTCFWGTHVLSDRKSCVATYNAMVDNRTPELWLVLTIKIRKSCLIQKFQKSCLRFAFIIGLYIYYRKIYSVVHWWFCINLQYIYCVLKSQKLYVGNTWNNNYRTAWRVRFQVLHTTKTSMLFWGVIPSWSRR